jgi:hypothetical protein
VRYRAAIGSAVLDRRGQAGALEGQHIARMQPLRVPRQRLPGAVGQRPIERDADARLATARPELRRYHARVVGDEDVAGHEEIGQVADDMVMQSVDGDVEKPRRISWPDGMLGDRLGRQVEVEIRETHDGSVFEVGG